MKYFQYILSALTLAVYPAGSFAQNLESQDDFQREIAPHLSRVQPLRDAKDYRGALAESYKALAATSLFSDDILTQLQLQPTVMYDIACYQSLCGDTLAAVSSLQAAAALGWRNYRQACQDTDLDPLRGNRYFQAWLKKLKEYDFTYILQSSAPYNTIHDDALSFTYATADDKGLSALRKRLDLGKVAGSGDEISKIKNITTFVHNLIEHNGSDGNPQPMNGMTFIDSCANGRRTLNCRGMAMLLNECLLSMGIPSRYITCYPKQMENDCHVINAVWSSQLGKWIWMDPSFNAWVTDDKGNLLGIGEVRARLISGEPLILNPEANHYDSATEKGDYLDQYMTKNLYAIEANLDYCYGAEDSNTHPYDKRRYVILVPEGFTPGYTKAISVSDDKWFWQAPAKGK